jgi:hypothetical protein
MATAPLAVTAHLVRVTALSAPIVLLVVIARRMVTALLVMTVPRLATGLIPRGAHAPRVMTAHLVRVTALSAPIVLLVVIARRMATVRLETIASIVPSA